MDDDTRRALEAEDRAASQPAEKGRVSHDEEPEVEGHRFYAGAERALDPSRVSGVRKAG